MVDTLLDNIGSGNGSFTTAPTHYFNQWWLIVKEISRNIFEMIYIWNDWLQNGGNFPQVSASYEIQH